QVDLDLAALGARDGRRVYSTTATACDVAAQGRRLDGERAEIQDGPAQAGAAPAAAAPVDAVRPVAAQRLALAQRQVLERELAGAEDLEEPQVVHRGCPADRHPPGGADDRDRGVDVQRGRAEGGVLGDGQVDGLAQQRRRELDDVRPRAGPGAD